MGKLIKIFAPILAIVVAAISVVIVVLKEDPAYEIDATNFDSVVAYYDDVDLSKIKIIEKEKEKVVKEIPVDSSMVKSIDPTTSVGDNKSLVIEYAKNEFNLTFSVKYKVQFIVDDNVISTQYALKYEEIKFPDDPKKSGYEFISWSGLDEQDLNDNVEFVATFTDVPLNRPNLGNLSAEYSDTLAKFTLPSNEQGRWEFVDDLSTLVGEIGQNRFNVQFIPANSELAIVKDIITINVSKKKLEFKNLVTEFQYDSKTHIPTFDLDVELPKESIVYVGDEASEVGTYRYVFKIVDDHYEGIATGIFTIKQAYITINVLSPEAITFGDQLPEIEYTVTGIEDPSILEIKPIYPLVNRTGTFDLLVEVSKDAREQYSIVINKGILVVNKANLVVSDPDFANDPIYLNTLSSVEIVNDNPNGYWQWVNPDLLLKTTGLNEFELKFIPNSSYFNEITKMVELTVLKKTVEIEIIQNTFTYSNTPYKVLYSVLDLEENYNVQVEGEITETEAGNYPVTLKINDNNYTGTVGTTLIIEQADLGKSFDLNLDPVYVETKLRDIALPDGYSWITPSTDLLTAGIDLEYEAKFTPSDTKNFKTLYGNIKLDVLKKSSQIYGVKESYSFDFDGTEKKLDGITSNPANAELVYTYTLNGTQTNRLYNAGTYDVKIEILENDFYLASEVSTTVTIFQAKDSKPAETVYAIYGDKLGMFTLPESSHGTWTWDEGNDVLVGDAGEIYHKAIFKSSDINYSNDYVNVKFIIEKKELEFIDIQSIFTYDTYEHEASYKFENDLALKVIIKNTDNQDDNGKRINAGTYQFNYIIDDNNYTGSQLITLTINKAIPVTNDDFAKINPVVYWNTALGDIELPEGYSFIDSSTTLVSLIGNNEFKAIYTPSDKDNYESVDGIIIVTASKITGSLDITNATDNTINYTYGDKYEITTSVNHNESALEYEYYLNDEKVDSITDEGTYKVIITLPESDHYNEIIKEIIIIVCPKTVDVTWTNLEEYIYNPHGQAEITAYYNDVNGAKVYLTLAEETNKEFMNAGKYSFRVSSNDSNYVLNEGTAYLDVEILKATFDMTDVAWNYNEATSYIYNGATYEVKLNNLPEVITPIYTENSGIDAKTYNASVKLEYDTTNYNTVDEIAGIEWKIEQANATVTWDSLEAYVYNATEYSYPTATINSVLRVIINLDVKLTNADSFKDAGTYKFEAIDKSGNYSLSDYTMEITIYPMNVAFNWEDNEYTYNGNVLAYPIASFTDAKGNIINVTPVCEKEFKDAGTYEFSIEYSDSNYTFVESTLTKTYTIMQAEYTIDNIKWSYTTPYTYNGSEYTITISGLPEGVTVKEYQNNKATNKGVYTAQAILEYDTANYDELSNPTITWEIKALEVEVNWVKNNTYIYGTDFEVPKASYKDVNNNTISLAVVEANNKTFEEVGSYTFIAGFDSNDNEHGNYILAQEANQINITVTQASVDDVTSITATYGDTLEDIESKLPKPDFGYWSFDYDDLASISVGNAGEENEFNVKFIASNENYKSFDSTIIIKVQKAKLTINVINKDFTYDGTEKTIEYKVEGFVNNETATSAGITVLGNISGTNVADSKFTTLTLSADNYYADSVNTALTITKAKAVITSTFTDFDTDYSGHKYIITSSHFKVSSGAKHTVYVSQYGVETDIINVGVYNVRVSAPATENYLAPDDLTFNFTVNKVDPKLEYAGLMTYTYGDTINATVTTNDDNSGKITYTYYKLNTDTNEYEVVSLIKEAGTYKLVAEIASTSNYNASSIAVEGIVVTKDKLDLSVLAEINATYGQYLSEFEFDQPDNGTWSWNVLNPSLVLVGNVGENVTHQAMFTPNDLDNYVVEYQDVKFNISAATLTIEIKESTFTYNGEAQKVIYEVSGFVCNDTMSDVDVVPSSGQITATEAGTYPFTLVIDGNSNYTGTVSGTLEITLDDPTYIVPTFTATYGDTYGSIDVIVNTGTEGSWMINADSEELVGEAGTHNVTATFTPVNKNYYSKTVQTTLTVNQATYIPTSIPTGLTATYGDKLASVELSSDDTLGTWSWKDTNSNALVGNAGQAKHYAVYIINDNYVPYEVELTINVLKANSIITNNITGNLKYNSNNQIDGLFTLNHNENVLEYVITKNGVAADLVNAGTYKIIVSVAESDNYNAESLTVEELIIEQATPETKFNELVYEAFWNTKLSDLASQLPNGYTFTYPNTVLDIVKDSQKFATVYTPFGPDAANYKTVNGEVTISVKKIITEIEANDYEFTYDINNIAGFTITASSNNTDENAKITYTVDGIDISENPIINAGTYTVLITANETDHYTKATKSITVVVNKAYEEIIVADSISYGATISNVKSNQSDYGTIVITDTDPNQAVSLASIDESFLGAVGEEVLLYAVFTPYEEYAANFASFVKKITITIVKKELTFTNITNTYTYDGNAHTILYELTGFVDDKLTSDILVDGNITATNVLESASNITLTINDINYYGTIETSLIINKADYVTEKDFEAITREVDWNKTLADIEALPEGYTFDSALTTSVGEVGTKEFDVTYTPTDINNYNIGHGKISVTVNKLTTTLTVSSYNNLTYISGKTYEVKAAVNHNEGAVITIIITYNGEDVDVLSNAGTYLITVNATETAHYKAAIVETEVEIERATPATDFTDVFTVKWTDSLTLGDITLDSGYTWTDSSTALDNIESKTYKAIYTPADTVNYNIVEGYFTVTVNKSDASVSSNAAYTYTYNGSAHTLDSITQSHNESSVIYMIDGETVSLINAGTYNVVIVLPESTHYNKATCNATVTIKKAEVTFEESYTATYGDTLGSLGSLPTLDYGTWTWKNGNDTLVGDAGTQTHQVVFTPSEEYADNYSAVTANAKVTVKQLTSTITSTAPTSLVYDGTTYDASKWFTLNHSYGTLLISVKLNNVTADICNAGTYTIVASLAETANVAGVNETYTLTINQATYTPTSIPTAATATYGDTLNTVELTGGDSAGAWEWVSGTDLVGGAGTRTHTAKFTPSDTNYAVSTHLITVTVEKKTLTFTSIVKTYIYSGSTQYIDYKFSEISDSANYPNVTGNDGLVNVGQKEFTLTVVDDNYEGTTTQILEITKATPTLSIPEQSITEDRVKDDYALVSSATAKNPISGINISGNFTYNYKDVTYPTFGDATKENTAKIEVDVTFTPTGENASNYVSEIGTLKVTLTALANVGETYFGTIEKAVDASKSGDVIWIMANDNIKPLIQRDITINTGVTMVVGYDNTSRSSAIAVFGGSNYANITDGTLTNTVIVSEGVNINISVGSTLEIAGQLSGGNGGHDAAGHTAGMYAQIILGKEAKINVSGTINCFGYINEEIENKSQIIVSSTGRINMPFVLRDFRGGTVMSGVYYGIETYKSSPFNSFMFKNISSQIRINYGGTLNAWANLYANSQPNFTNILMVGTSNAVINLTDAKYSYMITKYNPETEIHDIDIYGGATSGTMELSIEAGVEVNVSTADVYFPISWRYDISLNKNSEQSGDAIYNMSQRFKLMTGAKFVIAEGADLTINELAVYSEFIDELSNNEAGTPMSYLYPVKPQAELIVNGKLTANVLGGLVTTTSTEGAQLSVSTNTLTTHEPKLVYRELLTAKIHDTTKLTNALSLNMNDNGTVSSTATIQPAGVYVSMDKGWVIAGGINKYNIVYEEEGGNTVNDTTIYSFDMSYTIDEQTLPIPTRKYYNFAGWFYKDSSNNLVSIDNYVMNIPTDTNGTATSDNVSITLYASWTIADMAITYIVDYQNCMSTNYVNTNSTVYTINSPVTLVPATDGDLVFYGWYLDSDYTVKLDGISANMGGYGLEDITLYGYFSGKSSHIVLFEDNNTDIVDMSAIEVPDGGSTKLTNYNTLELVTDLSYSIYFVGWYTTSTFEDGTEFDSSTPVFSDLTLYARWESKKKVLYVDSNGTELDYEWCIPNTSYTILSISVNKNATKNSDSTIITTYLDQSTWQYNGINYTSGVSYTIIEDVTLSPLFAEINYYKFNVSTSEASVTLTSLEGIITSYSELPTVVDEATSTCYIKEGNSVRISVESDTIKSITLNKGDTVIYQGTSADAGGPYNIERYIYSISVTGDNCIVAGTLITLADGTKKPVEDITLDDTLLVFNHETGTYDYANIIFIDDDGWKTYEVINLVFSDGTVTKLIYEHGYFNLDLMKYVYINKDTMNDYIGHRFYKGLYDGINYSNTEVTLIDVYVTSEYTGCYSPVTVYHLNYFTDDLLSMPGGIDGLFNIFEYDDNLQYNQELMQKDIEMYGLFEYENLSDYVSYETYCAFPAKYFGVSIGKGYMTMEELLALIERYKDKI